MKTVINFKTEQKVKKAAQKVAGDLGLSLSAVLNAYLKQFVRDKSVHYEGRPRRMTPQLEKYLESIQDDIKTGKNISQAINSPEELKKYLFDYGNSDT